MARASRRVCWNAGPVAGLLSLVVALAALSPAASADGPDPLARYRERALSLEWALIGGFSVKRAGEDCHPGFFGGDAESVFEGSAGALEEMETYRALRISGTVLWAAGLSMVVSSWALAPYWSEQITTPECEFCWLLVGGAASGLVGSLMVQGANGYLADAVQRYNTDLAERLQPQASSPALRFVVSGRF